MRRALVLAAFGAAFLLAAPSSADDPTPACGERRSVIDHLAERYGERAAGVFVRHDGSALELLLDRRDGSWTILLSRPSGRSCVIGAGQPRRVPAAKSKPMHEEAV